jgi:hypothetical protein
MAHRFSWSLVVLKDDDLQRPLNPISSSIVLSISTELEVSINRESAAREHARACAACRVEGDCEECKSSSRMVITGLYLVRALAFGHFLKKVLLTTHKCSKICGLFFAIRSRKLRALCWTVSSQEEKSIKVMAVFSKSSLSRI